MKLTPENIEKIELKNLANVIRKANAGQTLSGRELALLASAANGARPSATSAFAKTQDELATRLGISRRTITNHQKDDGAPKPAADGRYDVVAWSQFLRDRQIIDEGGDEPEIKKNWKVELDRLKCERLELEMEVERRDLVPVGEVLAAAGRTFSAFRTALNQLAGRCAQGVVGLRDFDEIKEFIESEIRIILNGLEEGSFLDDPGEPVIGEIEQQPELPELDETTVVNGTVLTPPAKTKKSHRAKKKPKRPAKKKPRSK